MQEESHDIEAPDDAMLAAASLRVEAGVLRLCAAAQRRVPSGQLILQARELGRSASLLQVPPAQLAMMLRHSLDSLGCLDEHTVATLVAATLNAQRGLPA